MTDAEPPPDRAASPQPSSAPESLQRAEAAFAAGDYTQLRGVLVELARSDGAEARTRGAQLARAISVDPALIAVLLACLVVLGSVFAHYVLE